MASPNNYKTQLLNGNHDWVNDTIEIALGSDDTAYTFDPVNHTMVGDVLDGGTTATEFTGTGYSRQALSSKTTSQDDGDNEGVADAQDVTFSSLDGDTIQFIIIYQSNTDDSDSEIIAVYDDNSAGSLSDLPLTTNGGDVTISWSSEGIINIS